MRELDQLRRIDRYRAQRAAGIYRGRDLLTKAEVANANADHDIEKLPELFPDDDGQTQTAGGAALFMVDYSAIDGPDPIA